MAAHKAKIYFAKTKSVILASTTQLRNRLRQVLKGMGIELAVDKSIRDLGAGRVLNKTATKTQEKRYLKSVKGAGSIAVIVRHYRKARNLLTTGLAPAMAYSTSNIGLTPTALLIQRALITRALSLPRGTCATTATVSNTEPKQ